MCIYYIRCLSFTIYAFCYCAACTCACVIQSKNHLKFSLGHLDNLLYYCLYVCRLLKMRLFGTRTQRTKETALKKKKERKRNTEKWTNACVRIEKRDERRVIFFAIATQPQYIWRNLMRGKKRDQVRAGPGYEEATGSNRARICSHHRFNSKHWKGRTSQTVSLWPIGAGEGMQFVINWIPLNLKDISYITYKAPSTSIVLVTFFSLPPAVPISLPLILASQPNETFWFATVVMNFLWNKWNTSYHTSVFMSIKPSLKWV